eukprot:scaffold28279_cov134-Isochrysis_galbana.AAC.1
MLIDILKSRRVLSSYIVQRRCCCRVSPTPRSHNPRPFRPTRRCEACGGDAAQQQSSGRGRARRVSLAEHAHLLSIVSTPYRTARSSDAMKELLPPLCDVKVDVLALLPVVNPLPRGAGEPERQVLVVSPVPIVQLRRRIRLQRVARHHCGNVNSGSRCTGLSAQGDANVAYRQSEEFRLRPSDVRSVPRASVFRSGSVMRITERIPINPYRSDREPPGPPSAALMSSVERDKPPPLVALKANTFPRPPASITPCRKKPSTLASCCADPDPWLLATAAPGSAGKSSLCMANSLCGGCGCARNCCRPVPAAGRCPSDGKSDISKPVPPTAPDTSGGPPMPSPIPCPSPCGMCPRPVFMPIPCSLFGGRPSPCPCLIIARSSPDGL